MLSHKQFRLCLGLLVVLVALPLVPARAQTVSNFVTITPCRIADTRDSRYSANGLGPPFMSAHTTRNFKVLASPCRVPSTAVAYSLNITVIPHGPMPYLTVWPAGQPQPEVSTVNSYSGAVAANAAVVPAGKAGDISIYVEGETEVLIDVNGYYTQYISPIVNSTTVQQITQQIVQSVSLPTILAQSSAGYQSVALGTGASSLGTQNTAIGWNALGVISNGVGNSAFGTAALASNVDGGNNVAVGLGALANNASGSANVAVGTNSLLNNRLMGGNVAIGFQSMFSSASGEKNTAIGFDSLFTNNAGLNNIAIGYRAGYNVNNGDNIEIGSEGDQSDARTIRIGKQNLQTRTYIAGIRGDNTSGISGGTYVMVDANGMLGIQSSSRRYKEDIRGIGFDSARILRLHPVQFRYKKPAADGTKPLQYGLIAEEVEKIYPNLVERNAAGQIETVRYQELPALLLQQIKIQQEMIESLTARVKALEFSTGAGKK